MASGTAPGPSAPRSPANRSGKLVQYEHFIDEQLRKTRSHVRSVDIAGGLMTLLAGALLFFLAVAIVDHWLIPGGMGPVTRAAASVIFFAGVIFYFVRSILPLLVRRINPVYAAHTIERSKPSLKNGLVNFLFFRANPVGLSEVVYQAVEEQAATSLARVPVEAAVDRSKLIKLGYLLLGVLVACAAYTIASPRNPLTTIRRVVMPWADIAAPTRVRIADVKPGDGTGFRGQPVTVTADVSGVTDDDEVRLVYTTFDGETVDRKVRMFVPANGSAFTCDIPEGDTGLQESLEYRIEAGDASTRKFRIEAVAAPTLVVERVDYDYPTYTGLVANSVEHQGDIKGIEGTKVTIHALANQDIDSAGIDFECDGRTDRPMKIEGQKATITFTLAVKDDRETPEHASYQLLFKNTQGQKNQQPIRHRIDVTPDLPPTIEFRKPEKDDLALPANGAVNIELSAEDRDFRLWQVVLKAQVGRKPLLDKRLLDAEHQGQFIGKYAFDARQLRLESGEHLKAGDVVEYWGVAEDNKSPKPNHVETAKRYLHIASPDNHPKQTDDLAKNDQQQPDKQNPDKQPRPKSADQKPDRGQKNQPGDKNPDDKNQQDDKQQGENQQQDASDDPNQKGDKSAEKQPGKKGDRHDQGQGNSEKQPGDSGDKPQDGQPNDKSQDPQAGDQQGGDQQNQSGNDQSDNKKGGNDKSGNDKTGNEKGQSGKQPGGNQSDQKQSTGKGGDNADQADAKQSPVPNDHSDDRKAIERILDHAAKNEDKQGKPASTGNDDPSGREKPAGSETGKPDDPSKGQGNQKPEADQPKRPDPNQGSEKRAKPDENSSKESQLDKSTASGQDQPDSEKGTEAQGEHQGDGAGDNITNPKAAERNAESKGNEKEQPDDGAAKPDSAQPDKGQPDQDQTDKGQPDKAQGSPSQKQQKNFDPGKGELTDHDGAADKNPGVKPQKGQGDKAKGESPDQKQSSGKTKKPSGQSGGEPDEDKGKSGAGKPSDDAKGSPSPQDTNDQREKHSQGDQGADDKQSKDDAQSPSISKHQSDSQGDSEGTQSGGGGKGGGQKANQSGTGGAGKNTASDEGAGKANEPGHGEDSDHAGDKKAADKKTGQAGDQRGNGSTSKPQDSSQQKPDAGEKGSSGGANEQPKGDGPREQGVKKASGDSQEGGEHGTGGGGQTAKAPDQKIEGGSEERGEDANLEYAKKATELALAHLKDQLDKGDPELLDKLGWDAETAKHWAQELEKKFQEAQSAGPKGKARRELDDTLRSLGLRPRGASLKSNAARDDQSHGLKESRRTSPPPEIADQYKAYLQGTARGGK